MKRALTDVFVEGALRGGKIGATSTVPNVLMAFAIIAVLQITGLLDILASLFNPVMALFGLPGVAITVLIAAWMSMAGGIGVAANLYTQGMINGTQVTILLPAIFLMGAQLQYMGRILGTAGVQGRFYPVFLTISIINAIISMIIMRMFA